MSKKITAYLIDPFARTVTEVEGFQGEIDWIYPLLQCETFAGAYGADERMPGLLVDDDGLSRDEVAFFCMTGFDDPIGSRALVMDTDEEGASISPKMPLETFKQHIRWVRLARLMGHLMILDDGGAK